MVWWRQHSGREGDQTLETGKHQRRPMTRPGHARQGVKSVKDEPQMMTPNIARATVLPTGLSIPTAKESRARTQPK